MSLRIGALAWAVVGGAIAVLGLRQVTPDARLLVAVACVLGPTSAVAASRALGVRRDRLAGVLLLMSVVTPTFFAAALNLPALVVGAVLLATPRVLLRPSHAAFGS